MADISKEDLRKEIAAILKDADLASTSAKKVRQELEEKLDVKLQSRKKEIDDLVMEFVSSKKAGGKKKGKKDDSEEDGGEEDEEEEEEDEEPVKVANFTYEEITDMVLVFGRVSGNSLQAQQLYGDLFPERILPDHTVFNLLCQNLRQYGCFPEKGTYYGRPVEVIKKTGCMYMKPIKLSPELAAPVSAESMVRYQVVKKIWSIIKEEESEDDKKKKRGSTGKKPAAKKAKKGSDDDSASEQSEGESEEEYSPKKATKPAKTRKLPPKKKKGSESDSDEDWGKKKGGKKGGAKKGGGGYTKPLQLSPELSALVGAESMARHEVVKKVWAIIKEKNLYDPKNKQYAICDDALLKVIGTKRFRTFGMMKYLKTHFIS